MAGPTVVLVIIQVRAVRWKLAYRFIQVHTFLQEAQLVIAGNLLGRVRMSFHEETVLNAIESTFSRFYQSSSPKSFSTKSGARQLRSSSQVQSIAKELLEEAIASGLPLTQFDIEDQALAGGNTAMSVSKITLHAPFVLKVDGEPKTANEGKTIRKFRETKTNPEEFRECWPIVYAIRHEYPYAYLMEYFPREDGWISYEDRLFPPSGTTVVDPAEAVRHINVCLDILFGAYESSIDSRIKPCLDEDYVGRIRERLEKVAKNDARFASQPLTINGQALKPWQEYLDLIVQRRDAIDKITPPFCTVCIGDPNPGNIVLRSKVSKVEVKFIDPKEWGTGDYLFDIEKITHFIQATGPIEKPADGKPRLVTFKQDRNATLEYNIDGPTWTASVVDACLARTRDFAKQHNDPQWEARYELGMAANLLGLPLARLDKGREHSALVLYGEGIRWLDTFCQRLTGGAL